MTNTTAQYSNFATLLLAALPAFILVGALAPTFRAVGL